MNEETKLELAKIKFIPHTHTTGNELYPAEISSLSK